MKKLVLIYLCAGLLSFPVSYAETYKSDHFVIHSSLDSRYIDFVEASAEAYYSSLVGTLFSNGWDGQLSIYFSETQSASQKLSDEKKGTVAVFASRLNQDDESAGMAGLFRQIARQLIEVNFEGAPKWFKGGLACCLSEEAKIVKGELVLGGPNPKPQQLFKPEIEGDIGANIKRMFSSSDEEFTKWGDGCEFVRAFFYWLADSDKLEAYVKIAQGEGYSFPVLRTAIEKTYGRIKVELSDFISNDCYAQACFEDAMATSNGADKEHSFLRALEIKPDYQPAKLELAKYYYYNKDYAKCRENLELILKGSESVESRGAARLMGDTYYEEKDYTGAIKYYEKAWKYSDYYAYKYRVAYRIGNCYYYLDQIRNASRWYQKFVEARWSSSDMKACSQYAKAYVKYSKDPKKWSKLKPQN